MNKHLIEAIKNNIRYDGRKNDEWRKIIIETGVVANAEGSARVKFGDCEVIAGVKMSVGTPFGDRPDDGVLMVGAELTPMANKMFETGPPSIEAIEISRVIDRGVRESHAIDLKSLCIEKGEKVWIINVDMVPINHAGNLIDIGAIAAIAALKNAKIPELVDGQPDYKHQGKKSLSIKEEPIAVTVLRIGDELIVDPTVEEEKFLAARLTVTLKTNGNLCSLQKGGDRPLSPEDIDKMLTLATKKSKELRKELVKVK